MASDQEIYREWLRAQLEKRGRGSRVALARFLNLTRPDAITRMLNTDPGKETREISAVELGKMAQFFETLPPTPSTDEDITDEEKVERALASFDRLPDHLQKRFLARALGFQEPGRTAPAPSTAPKSGDKARQ